MSLDIVLTEKCVQPPWRKQLSAPVGLGFVFTDWVIHVSDCTFASCSDFVCEENSWNPENHWSACWGRLNLKNPSSPGNSPHWVALPSWSFQLFTEHSAKRIITGTSGGVKRAKIRSLILRYLSLKTPLQIRRNQSRKSRVHKEGKKRWSRGILLSGDH